MRKLSLVLNLAVALIWCGCSSNSHSTPVVTVPLSVTTTSLPNGTVGSPYDATLQGSGGTPPFTWSVTAGSWPAALALNSSTGVISGIPTVAGTFNLTVQATDNSTPKQSAQMALSIVVSVAPLAIATTSLPNGVVGGPYNATLQASGGTPPINWNVSAGSLPAGLALNASTGAISGTPTATGTANFVLAATDSGTRQQTAQKALNITIDLPNNSGVNGQYAFRLDGFDASGAVRIVGSFQADGAGNLTNGFEDIKIGTSANAVSLSFSGTYTVGPDNRGMMTINSPQGTSTFAIALNSNSLGVAALGHIIEYDTTGTNVSGVFKKQDSTAFSNAAITGDFVFGLTGSTFGGVRLGLVGRFTADGAGAISGGAWDINAGATLTSNQAFVGKYAVAPNGRGTSTLTDGAGVVVAQQAFYVISTDELFMIGGDASIANTATYTGSVLKQSGSPFSNASLNGISVISMEACPQTASRPCVAVPSGTGDVQVGLFSTNGSGSYTLSTDENNAGTIGQNSLAGTYSVASNGRVTITNTGGGSVAYLVTQNEAFLVGTDTGVTTGFLEPQATGLFTNSSLLGSFISGSEPPVVSTSPLESGVASFAATARPGTGNVATTSDRNQLGRLATLSSTAIYILSSNGRAVFAPNAAVMYIISSSKAVFVDTTQNNPTISVIEK